MRAAMVEFGGGILSANLAQGVFQQFYSKTESLDYNPINPPPFIGGHALTHLRYTPNADVYVTWGRPKVATLNWTEFSRIEYWVFITPEDLLNPHIDVKALLAKIATLENGAVA